MLFRSIVLISAVGVMFVEADDVDDTICGYNGIYSVDNGVCLCDPGWRGDFCESLDLLPAKNGTGLSHLLHEKQTSTWGGSVIYSKIDGMYHMYFSEITKKCGIHRWLSNSAVSHAVSKGAADDWTFQKKDVVIRLFSHEPVVAYDPSLELYVLFVTYYPHGSATDEPTCACQDGNSASGGCEYEPGLGANKTLYSYFSYSKSPNGPWSKLRSLERVQANPRSDMNLAPIIASNSSFIGWTRWDIWLSQDWRNVSSYFNDGQAPNWTDPRAHWEGEDPSMWQDTRGNYHILSHGGKRGSGDCGRHLFSSTGRAGSWLISPGCAFSRTVEWDEHDGNRTFYRRERPHLVFDGSKPVALTTAVIDSPTGPDGQFPQRDASYTLIQEISSESACGPLRSHDLKMQD